MLTVAFVIWPVLYFPGFCMTYRSYSIFLLRLRVEQLICYFRQHNSPPFSGAGNPSAIRKLKI